jgi:hypothetical protein
MQMESLPTQEGPGAPGASASAGSGSTNAPARAADAEDAAVTSEGTTDTREDDDEAPRAHKDDHAPHNSAAPAPATADAAAPPPSSTPPPVAYSQQQQGSADDADPEPQLKYERLGCDVKAVLKGAAATCLCLSEKVLALGTAAGSIHILDYSGNEVRRRGGGARVVRPRLAWVRVETAACIPELNSSSSSSRA